MSPELDPTEPDQPAPRGSSERKITANRANAKGSTGPKTPEGKAKSRCNALKHGLCAKVISIPDEDPALLNDRSEAWNQQLNPNNQKVESYLVALMARDSIKMDRCFYSREAEVAKLARDAVKSQEEEVKQDVENLIVALDQEQKWREIKGGRGLNSRWVKDGQPIQPGHAVRRLKATSFGCEKLLELWDLLRGTATAPVSWDQDDLRRALNLLGWSNSARYAMPSPLALATVAIGEHRDVAARIERNKIPGWVGTGRYMTDAGEKEDLHRIAQLAHEAAWGLSRVLEVMSREQALLKDLREQRIVEEAQSRSEATYRGRFDASESGRLMNRYEQETRREFIKTYELLKKECKAEIKLAQTVLSQGVTSKSSASLSPSPTPSVSRNEATEGAARGSNSGVKRQCWEVPEGAKRGRKGRKRRR